jgi:hypothetical protein
MWRIRIENENVTCFSLLEIIVSVIKQWTHWMWKTLLYWILFSSEFFRFILWFLCQLIQSFAMKRYLHDRIRSEKTSWKWRLVIHDCACFSSCEKSCVFHARHACFRITNREIDHFDRFRIRIEFFVIFFRRFIENDRLSWIKNVVNSDWWMQKWIVNKTKMKRWIIFDLKDCFFFSFLLKHFLLFIHLFSFFKQSSKTFEAFHHVVCVKIFFVSQHHQIRSFILEYVEDRSRQEEEFQMLSTLFQIFDDEVCF